MRKLIGTCAVLGLMVLLSTQANAQRPSGGLLGGLGGATLLMNKGVQEELKLTDEQKDKLIAKQKELLPKMMEMFVKFKDLPKEEAREKMGKMMKEFQEVSQKEMSSILEAGQIKRLKQIERQQDLIRTILADEEVVKAVKLNDEQKDRLKGLQDENGKDLNELIKLMRTSPKEASEKMSAIQKELKENTLKVLNDDQKDKLKEFTGEPFEVKLELGTFKKPK